MKKYIFMVDNDMKNILRELTHPQKRIWYIEKIYQSTSVHNIGGLIRIKGLVNFDALNKAINVFVERNEGIRIKFCEAEGIPMQYPADYKENKFEYIDFNSYQDPETELRNWIKAQAETSFDLEGGSLYYFALLKINDNESGYFVKLHHIISDGWSVNILTEKISDHYSKIVKSQKINEEVEYSYLEYVEKEKSYLASDRFSKNKMFWNKKLGSIPEDCLVKDSFNTKGKRMTYYLDNKKSESLIKYSEQNSLSLNTFFIALLLIYINKSTQRPEIIIGTPILNRSGKKEKSIFGMFTSTMPFKMAVDNDLTFDQFIKNVNSELMECYFNQKYPYDLLLQDIELKKKGYDNLFKVCVNYYNTRLVNEVAGMSIENHEFYSGNQFYPLQLVIKEWSNKGNLTLHYDYKVGEYDEDKIARMHKCIENFIDSVLDNKSINIGDLNILSLKEQKMQLYDFNSTNSFYEKDKTIYKLFEEQVERTPDRIALCFENSELSYRELNNEANKLAHYLRRKGIGPNKLVALMVSHSFEMVIGILGIIKAGAAYIPIDPYYPTDRINYMLEDSGADILLSNLEQNEGIIFQNEISYFQNRDYYGEDSSNLDTNNNPDDLVYIIYTSGSTGKPKGTMIEHSGLVNYIYWAKQMYIKEQNEIFALYSSLSFDLTVTSIFTPLIGGNKTIIYDRDDIEFVLYKIMRENKVHIVKLTPSHLSLLKDMDNKKSSVKRFIVGGEDLKTSLSKSIHESFGGDIEIYNEYGPTETVVGCMIYKYDIKKDKGNSVPIGKPANNVQIYILDEKLKPLKLGECGEMYISGDGVARGYLKKPDLTNDRFLPNPFLKEKRMYRTGDLARYIDEKGNMEYLGRADQQVKIRGYRIELGEIEKYLMNFHMVKEAVVIDREDENNNRYLCAYIVAAADVSIEELRSYLGRFLPEFMIPQFIIPVDKIPLTSNGKVNRSLLPEPTRNIGEEKCCVDARNEIEEILVEVIKDVLKIDRLGVNESFFMLGGDSIKAIQISSRLNSLGLSIKVKDILENPVIEKMALKAKSVKGTMIDQSPMSGFVRNTPITLWFFEQGLKNINHYNQSVLLLLKKEFSNNDIERALNAIIMHHDALRLNYDREKNALYFNEAYLTQENKLVIHDLDLYSEEEQKIKMIEIGKELKSSMDIEKSILFKYCGFNIGKNKPKYLLLTAHHLVIDGVSWRIILDDFSHLLKNIASNQELSIPNKSDSVKKWGEVLIEHSEAFISEKNTYWDNVINWDFVFPVDLGLSSKEEPVIGIKYGQVNEETTTAIIMDAVKAYGIKIDEVLIIALFLTIREFTGSDDMVLELESHGREGLNADVDLTRTVGWFTSMYPVRLKAAGNDLSTNIKSLKEQLRDIPNNGIGFGILKYLKNIYSQYNKKQIRFNHLGEFDNIENSLFELSMKPSGPDVGDSNSLSCLIEINSMIIGGKLNIYLKYDKGDFKDESMDNLLNQYLNCINKLASHCSDMNEREYTPSDFETIDISQEDLDRLLID
jgi:amino acid adenylation domain-containing protein/non-ribosomal peptide synthase protein (TIGR01720 family)